MTEHHHEHEQYEFAAKTVNDVLAKQFPDETLGFMSFVFDQGTSGYVGYLSSVERIDAFRMMLEWMDRMVETFDRNDIYELLRRYDEDDEHL